MAPSNLTALSEEKLESSFVLDEDERPKLPYNHSSNKIPVISLAGIDDDDGAGGRRDDIRKKIVEACEEWGIFQVVDHGVDVKLVSEMNRLAGEFFALPPEEKLRFDMSGGKKGGFMISNHLKGGAMEDWREVVTYFTYPIENRDFSQWPDKPEGLKGRTMEYSEKLMGLATKLLELLSEGMGLEKEGLMKACINLDPKFLVNFYPKLSDPDLTIGLNRHTEPGTITILAQDHVGGLQATKDGGNSWITVQPLEGAFVVNVGDHGHIVSNGRFKSADHKAVANSKSSRISIATFQYPSAEAIVFPLKVRESDEKPLLQNPITFAEMYKKKMSNEPVLASFNNKN